ncbi:MAG: ketoacyl-ACP synthase III [Candidatus Omnitrophica bacterium]|nr:ketoacyl-ACP synthase III [Candidatus Omnitrophota bacterium]MBU2044779.1 ketoacyl-ACP synthase III [Candidatus Omnitrophota bacterium]MBU2265882.1 ketoacyl-ACP synthase III [Candidatus Omnitrophota bacterium]MBU2473995.1 ketoacyl-ACP synthase III [Candidatus Omnitrophota bacterium]
MKSAKIVGLGKYLPSNRLTNTDLEKRVETSDEWITTRTGIKERRIVSSGEAASDLAYQASLVALKRAAIAAKDLDAIIVATVTPDTQFPSTACYLQNLLGASKASCFDLSAACSGFVYGLTVAWQFIAGGFYGNVLVVGSEVLSAITDWTDRSTCVLFGDGAGAAVLTATDKGGFLSSYLGADGSASDILILPAGGSRHPASIDTVNKRMHYMKMRGNELFRIAVRVMVQAAKKALVKADLSASQVDLFIPHQANERIISAVAARMHIAEDKIYRNIVRYGNMSSASSAVALCEAWEEGKIKKDSIVLMDTFGGGLVWGSCIIKWV